MRQSATGEHSEPVAFREDGAVSYNSSLACGSRWRGFGRAEARALWAESTVVQANEDKRWKPQKEHLGYRPIEERPGRAETVRRKRGEEGNSTPVGGEGV
jgi:hypothetical protein